MLPPLPPTDRPLIARVAQRLRWWLGPPGSTVADCPVFVWRTGGYAAEADVVDLRDVLPTVLTREMLFALDEPALDAPEVLRWFFEWYGTAAFFEAEDARVVQRDASGTLLEIGQWQADGNAPYHSILRAVEVVDATPRPDGTRQRYLLPVPPEMTTARAAVAWTFGLTADEYAPTAES